MSRRQFTITIGLLAIPAAVTLAYVAVNPTSLLAKLIASGAVSAGVLTGIKLMLEIVKLDADNQILRGQRESRFYIPSTTEVERYRRAHHNARIMAASGALCIVAGSATAILLGRREDPEKRCLRSQTGGVHQGLQQLWAKLPETGAVQQVGTTNGPPEMEIANGMPGVPVKVVLSGGGGRGFVLAIAERRSLALTEGRTAQR